MCFPVDAKPRLLLAHKYCSMYVAADQRAARYILFIAAVVRLQNISRLHSLSVLISQNEHS